MQIFEIDVCGEDLLKGDYSVCVASKDGSVVVGYRLEKFFAKILNSRWGQGLYRYEKSRRGKSKLKIRIYTLIIYHIFREINSKGPISLNICRDFDGQDADIRIRLRDLLENKLGLLIEERYYFCKLSGHSFAHKGAYLIYKKKFNGLIKINQKEFEEKLK